jgi:hypothetical protein
MSISLKAMRLDWQSNSSFERKAIHSSVEIGLDEECVKIGGTKYRGRCVSADHNAIGAVIFHGRGTPRS